MFGLINKKLAIAAAGALLAGTSAAQAHHHEFIGIGVAPAVACPPPAPVVTETNRVWVPPVYRTVVDHVWREPVCQTVVQHVFVPAAYETREYAHHGHLVCQRVLVSPAHYEDQPQQEVVAPGHYEDVERQELVCDGHWEVRSAVVAEPAPPPPPAPILREYPRVGFRIGW